MIIRFWFITIILIILLPGLTGGRVTGQNLPKGNLVIVGGGLEDNNNEVYEQMIRFAGGNEKASFAVIPSASGVAVQSFVSFKKALISYGVNPLNIHLIPIAMVDDDSTTTTDESKWSTNGNDPNWLNWSGTARQFGLPVATKPVPPKPCYLLMAVNLWFLKQFGMYISRVA